MPVTQKLPKRDLTGQRFNRLTVIRFSHRDRFGFKNWLCICDCSAGTVVGQAQLLNGNTQSCGCLGIEKLSEYSKNTTGLRPGKYRIPSTHPLYRIWQGIQNRCYKPTTVGYKYYGGRGIKVCERWLGDNGFNNFVEDMGDSYSNGLTIDRIDVNGNYEPNNCRWLTREENALTTRRMKLTKEKALEIRNSEKSAQELAIDYNIRVDHVKQVLSNQIWKD